MGYDKHRHRGKNESDSNGQTAVRITCLVFVAKS